MAQDRLRKGVYVLPNLITTMTLFGGFYAITAAIRGDFATALAGVAGAALADLCDGRVARMTNTQSEFGKEYDSLADLVAFGVATSLTAYLWSIQYLGSLFNLGGKIAWIVAFWYAAAAALRLARFNVAVPNSAADKNYFFGLSSPMAAAVNFSFIWLMLEWDISGVDLSIGMACITFVTACLMVSNIRYNNFKHFHWRERVPAIWLMIGMMTLAVIYLAPCEILFALIMIYTLSGPFNECYLRIKERKANNI